MKDLFKHIGLAIGGAALIAVGVFFPPVAPVLGVVGTKVAIAGLGALGLGMVSPEAIKAGVQAVKDSKTK